MLYIYIIKKIKYIHKIIYIVLTFSLSKNPFAFDYCLRISNLTKLIIQFLQSLGERFNTDYHDNIFKFQNQIKKEEKDDESESSEESSSSSIDNKQIIEFSKKNNLLIRQNSSTYNTTTITNVNITKTKYESVIYNLKRAFCLLDLENLINGEMPYDKLIIITTNFIDFLIEYIETTDDKIEIIDKNLGNLFFGIKTKEKLDIYESFDFQPVINVLFMKIIPDDNINMLNKLAGVLKLNPMAHE